MWIGRVSLLVLGVAVLLAGGQSATSAIVIGNDAPSFSPDGTRIAFTSFRDGNGEIYVMNADGSAERRLTRNAAHDDHAAWSPDGRRIAFASTRDDNHDIYVMNADGSEQRQLTNHPNNDYSPTWSPDGTRIAWRSDRDRNGEIYVMNADGMNVERITNNTISDQSPDWGRNNRITFSSNRNGGVFNIWSINPDGSDPQRITAGSTNKDRPHWSPDGTRVVYVSERDLPLGNTEIYIVNADGSGDRRVTDYEGRDDWPSWSPDGSKVLFTRGKTYRASEVYVANVDGSAALRLTTTAASVEVIDATAPQPFAGRRWPIWLLVEDPRGEPLQQPTAICRATIGNKPVPPAARAMGADVAHCAWNLPRSARGKLIKGVIGVRVGTKKVEVPFALRVR